jgi:hypothetical protein
VWQFAAESSIARANRGLVAEQPEARVVYIKADARVPYQTMLVRKAESSRNRTDDKYWEFEAESKDTANRITPISHQN